MNKLSIKNENIYIPLLFTGILSVTSFVPLFQILLLNLSGAIYYPFDLLFDNKLSPYFYLIFGFFTVCSLFLFYKTKSTSWKYV
ncbi:MAG TPA: hypothetical protein VJ941_11790, partial [Gracilimonas sp.]|nr:hypothetical protein [Gracilimonas sp.]